MCGVKNALRPAEDRKSWRKMAGGFGENTHELEKNAKNTGEKKYNHDLDPSPAA